MNQNKPVTNRERARNCLTHEVEKLLAFDGPLTESEGKLEITVRLITDALDNLQKEIEERFREEKENFICQAIVRDNDLIDLKAKNSKLQTRLSSHQALMEKVREALKEIKSCWHSNCHGCSKTKEYSDELLVQLNELREG